MPFEDSDPRKRLNPEFNRPFKKGDMREDGYIFNTYAKTQIREDGFYKESWLSPAAFKRAREQSKAAIKEWQKYRVIKRREFIDAFKLQKGCCLCGYNEHPVALDFDHLEPKDKKFTIGTKYIQAKEEDLLKEIQKCRILCANCHRVETLNAFKNKQVFNQND